MKAAIFDAPHQMHVGHWGNPEVGLDDVLVSVKAAGICAGDLYIYAGKNPYTKYPIIGGHEICGVVAGTGSNVTGLERGQLVVVEPFLSCGHCYPCRVGKPNCCANLQTIGVHRAGGYAEFVVAPATHVHAVPPGMSPLWASFAQPVTIAIHACRRGEVSAGEYVLILGCGPIGLALIEWPWLAGRGSSPWTFSSRGLRRPGYSAPRRSKAMSVCSSAYWNKRTRRERPWSSRPPATRG